MKKRLTRIITLILSILMLFSIGVTTSGCFESNSSKHMRQFMSNIPLEETGYSLIHSYKDGTMPPDENLIERAKDLGGSVVLNGKTYGISMGIVNYGNQGIVYTITYELQEVVVDINYIKSRRVFNR